MEGRLERVEGGLEQVGGRLDRVEGRLSGIDQRLDRIERTLSDIRERMATKVELEQTNDNVKRMADGYATIGAASRRRGGSAEVARRDALRSRLLVRFGDHFFLFRADARGFFLGGGAFTVLCQASVIASPSCSSSTVLSVTRVHPARPHAPLSGAKASGCDRMKTACSAGVSLTIPC